MNFTPYAPYNFPLTVTLMARFHGVLDHWRDGAYWRALHIHDGLALVRTHQQADGTLHSEVVAATGRVEPAALTALMRRVLCIDVDLGPFTRAAQADARLWRVVEPLAGLHHLCAPSVFEALVLVIIEQQISLKAALRAQRALCEAYGAAIDHAGERYITFPTPGALAAADPLALHGVLKVTHRRVSVILALARAVAAGELDLEGLAHLDDAAAFAALRRLKHVGGWTVAWTLIRGLSRYAYVGSNDVALRAAVAHYFYDQPGRVSAEAVADTFARYGEFAGLAAFYTLMRWAVERY